MDDEGNLKDKFSSDTSSQSDESSSDNDLLQDIENQELQEINKELSANELSEMMNPEDMTPRLRAKPVM